MGIFHATLASSNFEKKFTIRMKKSQKGKSIIQTGFRGTSNAGIPSTVVIGTVHKTRALTNKLIRLTCPNIPDINGQTITCAEKLAEKSPITDHLFLTTFSRKFSTGSAKTISPKVARKLKYVLALKKLPGFIRITTKYDTTSRRSVFNKRPENFPTSIKEVITQALKTGGSKPVKAA